LYLAFLTFTTSENGCAEPFSTCNRLSTLVIFCCCLQDDAKALCISNSNLSCLVIGDTCRHTRSSYKDIVFCTPKLTFLTILGFLGLVSPSVCNLPFLEGAKIDHGYDYNTYKESLLIDWLHLLANVKTMSISYRTLCQIHNVSYFSIFWGVFIFWKHFLFSKTCVHLNLLARRLVSNIVMKRRCCVAFLESIYEDNSFGNFIVSKNCSFKEFNTFLLASKIKTNFRK
jgi:hypothetical protein